jgi:sulfur-oxidizing protein SoxX
MKAVILIVLTVLLACSQLNPEKALKTEGKQLAFNREKGNCLACHVIEDGEFPGNIGPPLTNLSTRFKTKQELKAQIWDATRFNPETSMPPFGKNKILTDDEIDRITDYLWTIR